MTADTDGENIQQTLVQDLSISAQKNNEEVLAALPSPEQVQELVLLYQLSIHLLGSENPDEVIQVVLELLKERTKAAVVGFLWVDDQGQLTPKVVLPDNATKLISLSQSLTELVLQQGARGCG